MKTDDPDWEVVTSGNTIVNWDADTFVEQYDNGRFVIRRGFPDRKETILFDNELDLDEDDYFTELRGKCLFVCLFPLCKVMAWISNLI